MLKDKIFKKFYEEAKKDKNIIGFFLGGSRGKGKITKYSDYDMYVIVKNNVLKKYKNKYKKMEIKDFSFAVFSFSQFKRYATFGGPFEWNRYNFTHIKVLIDKNSKIQKLVNEKGKIPKNKIKKYISGHLDGYINNVYRSLKCFRDNNIVGARLEASNTVRLFLNIIFALHGGRTRPYYKYLEWELEKYPLKKFPMKKKELIKTLLRILEDANIKTQQKLFKLTEKIFRKEGYCYVFDSWEPEAIDFIKKFK
ncbi:MAG: hypothetical protein GTN40_01590 [Candidatus Aenigmarchaeota archaeon]|nr:hypothetical protein [Candidatus Aenigmarchaeota archaeon]